MRTARGTRVTISELKAEVARRREQGGEALTLVLPRECRGRRARVIPGVMGEVLCVNCVGNTVVRVLLADVERALARLS